MKHISVFKISVILLILLFFSSLSAEELIRASDLQQDGKFAKETGSVVVLMVSREECPYCDLIKNEILKPMLMDKTDQRAYILRELFIGEGDLVVDFDGQKKMASDISRRYRSSLTPTLLFLNHAGKQVHKKMIGINTVDFYPYYLDEAINLSIQRIKMMK